MCRASGARHRRVSCKLRRVERVPMLTCPAASGRPSLGPSNSLSRITSRLPSPAPSTCSTAAPPVDSASIATSSVDAIDLVSVVGDDGAEDEMDVDKTPPKPRAKATERKYDALPTPPLSSPTEMTEAVKRMELVRMKSDASVSTTISATSADETRPANPYKHLKSFLRLSSSTADTTLDRVIVGRAHEKQVVKAYLSSKETEVGMYVSGPPGTGKTALVTTMGREMAAQGWNVVEFGCMGLKPADMWKRLAERLGCEASEADISSHLQESRDTYVPFPPTHRISGTDCSGSSSWTRSTRSSLRRPLPSRLPPRISFPSCLPYRSSLPSHAPSS